MEVHKHRIYPWQLWADGREHVLRAGIDYVVLTEQMRGNVYQYARRKGFTVTTASRPEGLMVQFSRGGSAR